RWTHIRPPVCLDLWPVTYDARSEAFTAVSSWSSASWLKVDRNGETVLLDNTKRVSFLDFVDLPRHTSQPLELALYLLDRDPEGERRLKQAEKDAADRAHLESHGWRVRDSREVAGSPEAYRAYVQQSRGEFSCAKPSCMEFQNAWVSDRTLCYLASGYMSLTVCLAPANTVAYPNGGGHLWVYLNWALALKALGCRVIWLEGIDVDDSDTSPAGRRRRRGGRAVDCVATLKTRLEPY